MDRRSTFLRRAGFERVRRRRGRWGYRIPPREGLALLLRLLHAAEKSPVGMACSSVPKPTQVEWHEDAKARERNLVKELGTLTP